MNPGNHPIAALNAAYMRLTAIEHITMALAVNRSNLRLEVAGRPGVTALYLTFEEAKPLLLATATKAAEPLVACGLSISDFDKMFVELHK